MDETRGDPLLLDLCGYGHDVTEDRFRESELALETGIFWSLVARRKMIETRGVFCAGKFLHPFGDREFGGGGERQHRDQTHCKSRAAAGGVDSELLQDSLL